MARRRPSSSWGSCPESRHPSKRASVFDESIVDALANLAGPPSGRARDGNHLLWADRMVRSCPPIATVVDGFLDDLSEGLALPNPLLVRLTPRLNLSSG